MKLTIVAIVTLLAITQSASAALIPIYQVTGLDATWTETSNQGEYTVPTDAEDYDNEIWERPIKDNEWTDSNGTRTSNKLYYGYGDLKAAAWGVGTNPMDNMDYLFVRWEVVGAFQHEVGKAKEDKELEAHYYFYAEPAGKKAFAIEVPSGKDLGANFGDVSGKVNIYEEESEGDVPAGSGITDTEQGGDSFGNKQVKGEGRTNTSTFVTEVAVKLGDLGLSLADFDTAVDYAYTGVAVSNPSDPNTDLFANDHYPEVIGFGQEYDTLRMGNSIVPEPSSLFLAALGLLTMVVRRNQV